jgi:prophage regulatory protein
MNPVDRRGDSLLRLSEVKKRVGLSTATIYRRVDAGTFPRKVRLGPKSVAWYGSDIDSFIANPFDYRVEPD